MTKVLLTPREIYGAMYQEELNPNLKAEEYYYEELVDRLLKAQITKVLANLPELTDDEYLELCSATSKRYKRIVKWRDVAKAQLDKIKRELV